MSGEMDAETAPWFEEISFYARTAVTNRARRAQRAVEAACDVAGRTAPSLLRDVFADEKLTELASRVIEAAATATFEEKVRTLGRALGTATVAQDAAVVDTEFLFVDAISRLEVAHLRILTVLTGTAPHGGEPGIFNGDRANIDRFMRTWPLEQIENSDPGLAGISGVLAAHLAATGLAERRRRAEQ